MNKVELIGRITAEPELRYTMSNKGFTRFNLAVNRKYKNENGETPADFISIVAWEKLAEIICKYVHKGNRIAIVGRIQTGSYEREDGTKGYNTDIIAEDISFLESKNKEQKPEPEDESDSFADFGNSIDITDDDLPF